MIKPCQNTIKLERIDLGRGRTNVFQKRLDYVFYRIQLLQLLQSTPGYPSQIATLSSEIEGANKGNACWAKIAPEHLKRDFVLGSKEYKVFYKSIHTDGPIRFPN